jgi:hydrogenase maturation protein HypF
LAEHFSLSGWVINHGEGVKIDIQGSGERLADFVQQVTSHPPSLARIDQMDILRLSPVARQGFYIRQSQTGGDISVSVSPDQSVCPDCIRDLFDPQSRYYRYPFTNCTHCGPRYTIIEELPYDRCHTSMHKFILCSDCERAYHNPYDRRYHAQPVSCHHCGPQVRLLDKRGREAAGQEAAMQQAVQLLIAGGVLAVKGIGGFHLVCDATQPKAVQKLRALKQRRRKPFAVMVSRIEVARSLVNGEAEEWEALTGSPAPIVLMRRKTVLMRRKTSDDASVSDDVSLCGANSGVNLAPEVVPVGPYLGVMLPYTPLHILLFDILQSKGGTQVLVMTSGNISGMPLATEWTEIFNQFGERLDGILDHTRSILHACDDSVVHLAGGSIRMLRLARGYAPLSRANSNIKSTIMAMGAQQKTSVAFALPGQWILSPYIGDLDDIDTQRRYTQTQALFRRLYQCEPSWWVHDHHPGYFSTQSVARHTLEHRVSVQHHYAHILAVMAEHQLTGPVLGFAFDGTGWGDDQAVWGGEVLLADEQGYQRCGHLRPFRLIGGEQAIRQPARVLFAMLLECYSCAEIRAMALPAFRHWSEADYTNLHQLWQSGHHAPLCTSVGRLFDAWAALLMLVESLDFEGESGLAIEQAAACCRKESLVLSMPWTEQQTLDWSEALKTCLDAKVWLEEERIITSSYALLQALVTAIVQMAQRYASYPVVVSGGVFQNRQLMDLLWQRRKYSKQPLYSGTLIPVNDGGIALGQLWYALHQQIADDHI